MHGNTIETAWQDCIAGSNWPDVFAVAFKYAFFAGAGAAFLAVNDINASTETSYGEKQALLTVLHDEIDQFIRGRSPPTLTRQ